MRLLRMRVWLEGCAATVTAALFVLLQLSPSWVESAFGVDPDGGSGTLEAGLALASLAVTAALVLAARAHLRALRAGDGV